MPGHHSGAWDTYAASHGLDKAACAFSLLFGDGGEAQGLMHTKFLHSAPLPAPDTIGKGGEVKLSL